jgi:hypothetical protein
LLKQSLTAGSSAGKNAAENSSAPDPNKKPGRGIPDEHLQYITEKINLM